MDTTNLVLIVVGVLLMVTSVLILSDWFDR